eukprot:6173368-Pleurochrysis_carterae.AAC.1
MWCLENQWPGWRRQLRSEAVRFRRLQRTAVAAAILPPFGALARARAHGRARRRGAAAPCRARRGAARAAARVVCGVCRSPGVFNGGTSESSH